MSSQLILYDLPSQQGTSWSLNPWKTRMILNYKGINYRTQWVEYPDLVSTFKSFGLEPNDKNAPGYFTDYTSPAIRYEDGTYGMDSWPIAHELERRYPSPSLHLDDPIVRQIQDHVNNMKDPMIPHFIPKVPLLLPKRSADYFYDTRKKAFGAPLPEIEKKAGEEDWEKAKALAKVVGDLLRKNGGPFFLGETVSYADFIFVSWLHFIKRIDKDETLFERFLALDPAFPKIYRASQQWLGNED